MAEKDGYRLFYANGTVGEEIHYTSIRWSYAEGRHLHPDHPGSILYRRTASGLEAVGVMYGAPNTASAAELDQRAPLSIAIWHRHVDFCGALKGAEPTDIEGRRENSDSSAQFIPKWSAQRQEGTGSLLPLAG